MSLFHIFKSANEVSIIQLYSIVYIVSLNMAICVSKRVQLQTDTASWSASGVSAYISTAKILNVHSIIANKTAQRYCMYQFNVACEKQNIYCWIICINT